MQGIGVLENCLASVFYVMKSIACYLEGWDNNWGDSKAEYENVIIKGL